MNGWRQAFALAWRGLRRADPTLLAVQLLFTVALTVMIAGAVVHRSVVETARGQARELLGGDLLLETTGRPLEDAVLSRLLPAGSRIATVAQLQTFARLGDRTAVVSVEAVDGAWPLLGRVESEPASDLAGLLADGGALVEPRLLARLGIRPGTRIRLGPVAVVVRALLRRQPDRLAGGLALGPRVLVARATLEGTPLLSSEAFVRWRHAVLLPAGVSVARAVEGIRARAPDARFRLRTADDLLPRLARLSGRLTGFATLVAATLLALGMLAAGLAVRAHTRRRRHDIAVLRALGAGRRLLDRWMIAEGTLLLATAVLPALALGLLLPALALPVAGRGLPLVPELHLRPADLLLPVLVGLGAMVAAALPPLAACRRTPPARLFRTLTLLELAPPGHVRLLAGGLLAAVLVLIGWSLPDRWLALGALLGLPLLLLVLLASAWGLGRLARRFAQRSRRAHRALAWRLLAAPDAPVRALLLALGFAVALATVVAPLTERLRRELLESLPARAAALFLIDIRPSERPRLDRLLARHGARLLQEAPVVRARVVRIAGVPVERARIAEGVRWTVRADRALTWRRAALPDDRLRAGRWWPDDYRGPPLVAVEGRVAEGYGIEIGDTISFNVLGRTITARVTAIREPVDWTRGRLDFVFVLSPGLLERAPHSWIAAVDVPPAREAALLAALARELPTVAAVPVREVVARVGELVRLAARVLLVVGALVGVAVLVVLLVGLRASEAERRHQLLVLRALGATRGELVALWLRAFTLVGLAGALPGALIGWGLAALASVGVFHLGADFAPATLLLPALVAVSATALTGVLGTLRLLRTPVGRLFAGH